MSVNGCVEQSSSPQLEESDNQLSSTTESDQRSSVIVGGVAVTEIVETGCDREQTSSLLCGDKAQQLLIMNCSAESGIGNNMNMTDVENLFVRFAENLSLIHI